jgi:Flp pilus assembly protein TadG
MRCDYRIRFISIKQSQGFAPAYRCSRRGIAAVELALLVPLLCTLAMGMFELGRLVMVKQTLTNAARKACRTGATPGKTYQNLLDDANNILTDNGFTPAHATITVQLAPYTGSSTVPAWGAFQPIMSGTSFTPNPLDKISVQVAIPVLDVLWFAPQFTPSSAVESETLILLRQG